MITKSVTEIYIVILIYFQLIIYFISWLVTYNTIKVHLIMQLCCLCSDIDQVYFHTVRGTLTFNLFVFFSVVSLFYTFSFSLGQSYVFEAPFIIGGINLTLCLKGYQQDYKFHTNNMKSFYCSKLRFTEFIYISILLISR